MLKLKCFFQVSNSGELWHTSSINNGADRATRLDSLVTDITDNSSWQIGPLILSFLHINGPLIETLRHVRRHASLNMKFSNVSGV